MTLKEIEEKLYELLSTRSLHIRLAVEEAHERGELFLAAKDECRVQGIRFKKDWVKRFPVAYETIAVWMRVARAAKVQTTTPTTIDGLLKTLRKGRSAEKAEERREAAARAAEAELIGDNDIICADSLDWLRSQPDDSVPFFVSDPPYGIGLTYDGWTESDNADDHWRWFEPYWKEMVRVLQPGGSIILWQAYVYLRHLPDWFPDAKVFAYCFIVRGLHFWNPIIHWTKAGRPICRHRGMNSWLVGTQQKHRLPDHPSPKPLEDCRKLIKAYTLADTLVVDPFCGLGSIPLACALEGRKWMGVERSPQYAAVARQRLHEATTTLRRA